MMGAEVKADLNRQEAEWEKTVFAHSVISHLPGHYYEMYPGENQRTETTEEFIPESPEDLQEMFGILRQLGYEAD